MEVRAGNRQIEKLLKDPQWAIRQLGDATARRFLVQLRTIRAATSVEHLVALPSLRFHKLTGDWEGYYSIRLGQRFRLICSLESSSAGIILTIEEVSRDHYQDL